MFKSLRMRLAGWGGVFRRLVLLTWALGLGAGAQALTLTDDRGVSVRFNGSPQRIVSLLPSLTESVCALRQCARLVGVDQDSNFPPDVKRLPSLGGGLEPNIEAIVALRPDVVLLATSSRASARLEALGLKVLALEPRRHADVLRVLQQLGSLLEVPDSVGADRVWLEIQSGLTSAAQSLSPAARRQRVYFEAGRGPYAAGEASFIGQTLARLGVQNVVPAALGPFPRLNPEFVVRANPDVILVGGGAALASYPGWSALKALQEQRLCVFSAEESDVLARPGPRLAEAAQLMANCLSRHAR